MSTLNVAAWGGPMSLDQFGQLPSQVQEKLLRLGQNSNIHFFAFGVFVAETNGLPKSGLGDSDFHFFNHWGPGESPAVQYSTMLGGPESPGYYEVIVTTVVKSGPVWWLQVKPTPDYGFAAIHVF